MPSNRDGAKISVSGLIQVPLRVEPGRHRLCADLAHPIPPPPGELGIAAAIDEVAAPTEEQIEEVLAEAGV